MDCPQSSSNWWRKQNTNIITHFTNNHSHCFKFQSCHAATVCESWPQHHIAWADLSKDAILVVLVQYLILYCFMCLAMREQWFGAFSSLNLFCPWNASNYVWGKLGSLVCVGSPYPSTQLQQVRVMTMQPQSLRVTWSHTTWWDRPLCLASSSCSSLTSLQEDTESQVSIFLSLPCMHMIIEVMSLNIQIGLESLISRTSFLASAVIHTSSVVQYLNIQISLDDSRDLGLLRYGGKVTIQ